MSAQGLPQGWASCSLGNILTIVRGVSYSKDDASNAPRAGMIPLLRATNIDTELCLDDCVYVPASYVDEEQRLREGDIVIAASSGSKSVVGKAAQLRHSWDGSFGAFCMCLRPC